MRSLYAKLAVVLTVLFGAIAVGFVLLMSRTTERYQQEVSQELNAELASHIVEARTLFANGQPDTRALESLFHDLMVINPKVELYLLDQGGSILAYSAPAGRVRRQTVDLGPVRRFVSGDYEAPLEGDDPRNPGRHKVFSAAPVRVDGQLAGYLYIILASELYDGAAQRLSGSYAFRINALTGLLAVVFALFAGLLLFGLLTRRLRNLTRAVEHFSAAGFSGHLPEARGNGDEIDRLTASINEMAARIAAQVRSLQETDTLRRELVANVSHDLRTPLASLQGYLETLHTRGQALDPAQQRNYLEVAHRDCLYLGRLVDELFDLARLDANEVEPVREPFSLTDLLQDVVHKFELRAGKRNVSLNARHDGDLPMVIGDIALVERVLDNLLENALRHTPPGGSVTLQAQSAGSMVAVQVADTGPGIPASELSRIFERFQQAERQAAHGGAGLGLAIASRIVELHGGGLRADSVLGSGTTFSFELATQAAS